MILKKPEEIPASLLQERRRLNEKLNELVKHGLYGSEAYQHLMKKLKDNELEINSIKEDKHEIRRLDKY
ncbi:MAG: hypothetical protein AAF363_14435 [Bacteroidota bacterium]